MDSSTSASTSRDSNANGLRRTGSFAECTTHGWSRTRARELILAPSEHSCARGRRPASAAFHRLCIARHACTRARHVTRSQVSQSTRNTGAGVQPVCVTPVEARGRLATAQMAWVCNKRAILVDEARGRFDSPTRTMSSRAAIDLRLHRGSNPPRRQDDLLHHRRRTIAGATERPRQDDQACAITCDARG
jgi:hypothetical protein